MYMKLSWSIQLLAGILLFAISFLIEWQVLAAYLDNTLLGAALAGALELSKALTIVLYRFVIAQHDQAYPGSVRLLTLIFRLSLLGLSLVCSVMFLAQRLDRPYLAETRAHDQQQLDIDYQQRLRQLRNDHQQRLQQSLDSLRTDQQAQQHSATSQRQERIARLDQLLTKEMDNRIGGTFRGPRYRELEQRLRNEKAELDSHLQALATSNRDAPARLRQQAASALDQALQNARADYQQQQQAITNRDYRNDPRVHSPLLYAFLQVADRVIGWHSDPLVFVFWFSLFLAVLIELGILVAFEILTLSHLPLFQAQHRLNLAVQRKRTDTNAELAEFDLDENLQRKRTKSRVASILERLDTDNDTGTGSDKPPRTATSL